MADISVYSPLVIFSLYVYGRNYKSETINILIGFTLLGFSSDLVSNYLISEGKGNLYILDIFFPTCTIWTIVLYYNIYLQHRRVYQILCTVCLPSLAFFYVIFWRESTGGQSTNWTICTLLVGLMAIGHFYTLFRRPMEHIKRHAPYWISIGFFFYSSISMIIFSLHKYLLNNFQLEVALYAWTFHNLMNIAKNLCFGVAIAVATDSQYQKLKRFSNIFKSLNQLF